MQSNNEREPNQLEFSDGNNIATIKTGLPRQTLKHHTPVVILINIRSIDTKKTSAQNDHDYLKHFRQIYEENGWITVQCTPTEDRLDSGEAEQIVSTLFACLQNRAMHMNPIIMHVLGHQGLPIHNAICQFVKDEQDLDNSIYVKGCILDSCPKQPNGLMENIREVCPTLYDLLMLLICLIRTIFPELFRGNLHLSDYETFCYNSGTWPQLYLYSMMDPIVPYMGVEKAIRIRGDAGVPLEMRCWNDTEHARHLFVHGQEYADLCLKFVQDCLALP